MALMDDAGLKALTKKTSQKLFSSLKGGSGFETWKRFDKGLARELSLFFTGVLYSREVISQKQRSSARSARSPRSIAPTRCARTSTRRSTSAPPARKWRR